MNAIGANEYGMQYSCGGVHGCELLRLQLGLTVVAVRCAVVTYASEESASAAVAATGSQVVHLHDRLYLSANLGPDFENSYSLS